MDIKNYLIDHSEIDWKEMLSAWEWLLPEKINPWMLNQFGDLLLVFPDETIHLFDTGEGRISKMADSKEQCLKSMDDCDHESSAWLKPLVVDTLVKYGKNLSPGTCYSFEIPPGLGGEYEFENINVYNLSVHYSVTGQLFERMNDIPEVIS